MKSGPEEATAASPAGGFALRQPWADPLRDWRSVAVSDARVSAQEKTPKQWECSPGAGTKKLLIKSCYKAAKGEKSQWFGILQAIHHGHYTATT